MRTEVSQLDGTPVTGAGSQSGVLEGAVPRGQVVSRLMWKIEERSSGVLVDVSP